MTIRCCYYPTNEEGEAAIAALKKSMPSKRQTEYNQRDIRKRRQREAARSKGEINEKHKS